MSVTCKQCKAQVQHDLWISGQHDCPLSLDPMEGESWDDYSTRSDNWRAMVRSIAESTGRPAKEIGREQKEGMK
jgi:hypothetical protein